MTEEEFRAKRKEVLTNARTYVPIAVKTALTNMLANLTANTAAVESTMVTASTATDPHTITRLIDEWKVDQKPFEVDKYFTVSTERFLSDKAKWTIRIHRLAEPDGIE